MSEPDPFAIFTRQHAFLNILRYVCVCVCEYAAMFTKYSNTYWCVSQCEWRNEIEREFCVCMSLIKRHIAHTHIGMRVFHQTWICFWFRHFELTALWWRRWYCCCWFHRVCRRCRRRCHIVIILLKTRDKFIGHIWKSACILLCYMPMLTCTLLFIENYLNALPCSEFEICFFHDTLFHDALDSSNLIWYNFPVHFSIRFFFLSLSLVNFKLNSTYHAEHRTIMYENVFCICICQSFVTMRVSNPWHNDINYIFICTLLRLATAAAAFGCCHIL